MAKKRDWRLLEMAAIGTLVIAAMWPGKQGKILSVQYVDGEALIELNNATLGLGPVDIVVYYMNTSSDPMDTKLTIELVGQDGVPVELQSLTGLDLHPNVEEPGTFTVTLGTEGDYTLNVTLYEEGTMKRLDSKSVSFLAREPVSAEFRVSGLTVPIWQVEPGTAVNASVLVENIGTVPGEYTVTFICDEIDGGSMERSVTLVGGYSRKVYAAWYAQTEGVHTVTADGLSKTYAVGAVVVEKGHIEDFLAFLGGEWVDITGLTVGVPSTLELAVSWVNDLITDEPDIKGYVALHVQAKNPTTGVIISEYDVAPTSGQGTQAEPGSLALVFFNLAIDQEADYYLDATLEGEIV